MLTAKRKTLLTRTFLRTLAVGWIGAIPLAGCSGGTPNPTHPRAAPPYDLNYRETRTYHITKDERGKYQLSSVVKVSITPLSPRATEQVTYGVHEPFYAKVEDLEADKDGDGLSANQMETVTSEGQAFLYNDQIQLLKFKDVHIGQTISWQYRQKFIDISWFPWIRLPNHDRLEHFQVIIKHPPEVKVTFDIAYHHRQLRPTIIQSATASSITFDQIPHVLPLEYFAHNESQATIWIHISQGQQALTPLTPGEYTAWHLGLFKPFNPFTAAQQQLIDRLVQGAPVEVDKVKRLYDWVRANIRYLADERGINGIVPRDPPLVMERRYGDCKDMAHLLTEMARTVGVRVDPVLVGVELEPDFAGVHDWTFDHVIASYLHQGRRLFFDPTCELCEFTNLPEEDIEKVGLLFVADHPEKLTIPLPEQEPSMTVDLRLLPDKPTEASAEIVLRNDAYRSAVNAKRRKREERLQAQLSRLIGAEYYRMVFSDFTWGAQEDGVLRLAAKARLDQFIAQSSNKIYFPKVPFHTRSRSILTRVNDQYPIQLNDYREHLVLRLHLPRSHFSAAASSPLAFGDPEVGLFSAKLNPTADELVFEYSFQQRKKLFVEGARRDQLIDLYRNLMKSRNQMFAVELVSP